MDIPVIGAVVSMISGGPPMTVETIQGEMVRCAWFVDGHLLRDAFHLPTLRMGDGGVEMRTWGPVSSARPPMEESPEAGLAKVGKAPEYVYPIGENAIKKDK